jgi:hypothetical protein
VTIVHNPWEAMAKGSSGKKKKGEKGGQIVEAPKAHLESDTPTARTVVLDRKSERTQLVHRTCRGQGGRGFPEEDKVGGCDVGGLMLQENKHEM